MNREEFRDRAMRLLDGNEQLADVLDLAAQDLEAFREAEGMAEACRQEMNNRRLKLAATLSVLIDNAPHGSLQYLWTMLGLRRYQVSNFLEAAKRVQWARESNERLENRGRTTTAGKAGAA